MAHDGVAPGAGGHRPKDERKLAQRFARLRTKAQQEPAAVSGEAQRLLRRVQAEIGPLAVVLQREQEAAQVPRDFADDHGVNGLLATCLARRGRWGRATRTAALRRSPGS